MAFSYGFFNSHSGDRTYNAKQFGSIFDGIINDGVFRTIGQQFKVSAGDGMKVKVGSGRGWFCHTWVLNTSDYTVSIPQSEVLLNRVDALVLEIDHRDDFRRTRLTVIKGPAENLEPTWPPTTVVKDWFNFWDTDDQKQIPIAYIRVLGKVTQINTVDLFSVVGKAAYGGPPFVTGPLQTIDASVIYANIEAQWNSFYSNANNQLEQISRLYNSVNTVYNQFVSTLQQKYREYDEYANQQLDQIIRKTNLRADELIIGNENKFNNFISTNQERFEDFLQLSDKRFQKYMNDHNKGFNEFVDLKDAQFNEKMDEWNESFYSFWTDFKQGIAEYLQDQKDMWETWFQYIQGQLSNDAATNLQREIDALCFCYIFAERLVLGITASAIHERVLFGTYGSCVDERAIISAPIRDSVRVFGDKAVLGIVATVLKNVVTIGIYGGATGERVIIESPSTRTITSNYALGTIDNNSSISQVSNN